jgi:hypothetical protein
LGCLLTGGAEYDSDDDFRGGGKAGKGGGKKNKGGGKAAKAAEKGAVKGKGGKADKAGSDSKATAGPHAGAPSAAAMEAAVVKRCPSMEGEVGGGDGDETVVAALVKLLRPAALTLFVQTKQTMFNKGAVERRRQRDHWESRLTSLFVELQVRTTWERVVRAVGYRTGRGTGRQRETGRIGIV